MKRTEHSIYFLSLSRRNEVSAVYEAFIAFTFNEDCTQIIHQIFIHLVIRFQRDPSETICNISISEDLVKITVEGAEWGEQLLFGTELFNLSFLFLFLCLQTFIILAGFANNFKHVVKT